MRVTLRSGYAERLMGPQRRRLAGSELCANRKKVRLCSMLLCVLNGCHAGEIANYDYAGEMTNFRYHKRAGHGGADKSGFVSLWDEKKENFDKMLSDNPNLLNERSCTIHLHNTTPQNGPSTHNLWAESALHAQARKSTRRNRHQQ